MIFARKNIEFKIINVFKINQSNVMKFATGRNYSCISFRQNSNVTIEYNNKALQLSDGTVSYFPKLVDYKRTAQNDELIAIDLEVYNYNSNEIEFFKTKNFCEMNELFNNIYEVWNSPSKNKYYKTMALIYELLSMTVEECVESRKSHPEYLDDAIDYMHTNFYDSKLSITKIAKHVSTNEVYLRNSFREYLNISPKQYLQNLRIQRAKAMLESGYFSVTEVAYNSGFEDEKYFSTIFKKSTGYKPSEYKKQKDIF